MDEIIQLIIEKTGVKNVDENSDIEYDLGCYGDDFHELMEEYSKLFHVDMSSYLWYFHTEEEGISGISGLFFKPPNKQVKRIPVTPKMLYAFAKKGKWDINYPKHTITERKDLKINRILIYILLSILLLHIIYRWITQ